MTKPAPTLSTAQRPLLHGPQSVLALLPSPVDHHAHDEVNLMRTLVDAVATGDRDAVFTIARCLVSGSTAVVEQRTTFEDKWLTPAEAAVYANVSRMTIWRWCNERGLAFTKVGSVVRIRSAALQKFMEQHESG